jgi:hypothetical protein
MTWTAAGCAAVAGFDAAPPAAAAWAGAGPVAEGGAVPARAGSRYLTVGTTGVAAAAGLAAGAGFDPPKDGST